MKTSETTISFFKKFLFVLTFFIIQMISPAGQAQETTSEDELTEEEEELLINTKGNQKKKDKKAPTIEDFISSCKRYQGLFTVYQDTIDGDLFMLVSKRQLEKEFIYFSQIANGVADASSVNGTYKETRVLKIKRYFDQLQFEFQNTSFYYDPDNTISASSNANISNSIAASEKILASDEYWGRYLIKANNLFLNETLTQIKPVNLPFLKYFTFTLGSLDKKKTRVEMIRNYPENTDLEVTYVYSKSSSGTPGSRAITDERNVSISVWHSFVEMPNNEFKPRFDDPRVGYFTVEVNDLTSSSHTPYRDLINRWHLTKMNENSLYSHPEEPITWWIENTTPKNFRPIIKEAVRRWNKVFESIGYKDAIVVYEQPDTANWDAYDIRYNVIRWMSSPSPRFSGYGPSMVNPRTGQILGADIVLEYATLSQQLSGEKVFEKAGLGIYDSEEEDQHQSELIQDPTHCSLHNFAQTQQLFGSMAIQAMNGSEFDNNKMIEEYILFLVLHEMGHTLGLNHNMKASQLLSIHQLNNRSFTENIGLVSSVMDYPTINLATNRDEQGQYWPTKPGPYDQWALEFGYGEFDSIEDVKVLLSHSADSSLIFGNDADDMRMPGKAIDPRANIGDMSNDAIGYAIDRIKLTREVSKEILTKFTKEGESYEALLNSYLLLTAQQYNAAHVISRYIGGVYVDRSMYTPENTIIPFQPVEKERQEEAMEALATYVFSPDAFMVPNELYNFLQPQRRGYNHYNRPEDPKIHKRVLSIQESVLKHLLHANTLQRISDSELYGNSYSLPAFLTDLNESIFLADINHDINSFRQNLQLSYTDKLISIITGSNKDKYLPRSHSLVVNNLYRIKAWASSGYGNVETTAHKTHLKLLIDNALKEFK